MSLDTSVVTYLQQGDGGGYLNPEWSPSGRFAWYFKEPNAQERFLDNYILDTKTNQTVIIYDYNHPKQFTEAEHALLKSYSEDQNKIYINSYLYIYGQKLQYFNLLSGSYVDHTIDQQMERSYGPGFFSKDLVLTVFREKTSTD